MRFGLVCLVLILSACAGLDSSACRDANWYEVGFRDAIFGLQRQDIAYAAQCAPHGVKLDVALYAQGWQEGKWEADDRRDESAD